MSNISFNSADYFQLCISNLYNEGVIDWAYWIVHKADRDDKKEHIHFCFQPSKAIDTVSFNKHFLEFSLIGDHRAKRPTTKYMPVISLDDWLLYCKHDENYLITKGLERIFHYTWSDFCYTDQYAFEHDINNIDSSKYGRLSLLRDGVKNRIPFAELIQQGSIPIVYRSQYEAQYKALQYLEKKRKLAEWERIPDNEQIEF